MESIKIALAGNPNCGKTALFNALTGSHQHVGNWPGVTVDKKTGYFTNKGKKVTIVDLPGIYSLGDDSSLDEQIARDYLLSGEADIIINIVDVNQLERHLVLTSRLLEYGVPVIVVANMMDVARKNGAQVDLKPLEEALNVPVLPMVACKEEGIEELKNSINEQFQNLTYPQPVVHFSDDLEEGLSLLQQTMVENQEFNPLQLEGLSRQIIEDMALTGVVSDNIHENIQTKAREIIKDYQKEHSLGLEVLTNQARFKFAKNLMIKSYKKRAIASENWLDKIVLNRFLGVPIFLFVMYLLFMLSVKMGDAFVDLFDISAGTIFVDTPRYWLEKINMSEILIILIADGLGSGIQTVITFIPVIGFLFLFLSFLEDCGYLARAAFVVDRFMSNIGLPGKAFVPLITGFGCTVSAVMGTRTLDQHRDRIMTTAMAPFMSCGARLPVYVFFAAAFFPRSGQNLVFFLYLFGIIMAMATGFLLKKTILKSDQYPMVLEIPRWHMPIASNVLRYSWHRLHAFLTRASRIIIPMVALLTILNSVTPQGKMTDMGSENTALASIGRSITPIFKPMGIKEDNWPATVGIFTGILAKEALVGTLDALYGQIDGRQEEIEEEGGGYEFIAPLKEAALSVPTNIADLFANWRDPMGLNVGDMSNIEQQAEEQEVNAASFTAIQTLFNGTMGAFAYLVFILLYMPCSAATAAIFREEGRNWGIFIVIWTNMLAWISATMIYQISIFPQQPFMSIIWVLICCLILLLFGMYLLMKSRAKQLSLTPSSA